MSLRILMAIAFLFAGNTVAGAEDYSALFEEAVENINWNFQDEWAYTETSLKEGKLWIGRYDPRRDEDDRL